MANANETDGGGEYTPELGSLIVSISSVRYKIGVTARGLVLRDVLAAVLETPKDSNFRHKLSEATVLLEKRGHRAEDCKLRSLKGQRTKVCSWRTLDYFFTHETGLGPKAELQKTVFYETHWESLTKEYDRLVARTSSSRKRPPEHHPEKSEPAPKRSRVTETHQGNGSRRDGSSAGQQQAQRKLRGVSGPKGEKARATQRAGTKSGRDGVQPSSDQENRTAERREAQQAGQHVPLEGGGKGTSENGLGTTADQRPHAAVEESKDPPQPAGGAAENSASVGTSSGGAFQQQQFPSGPLTERPPNREVGPEKGTSAYGAEQPRAEADGKSRQGGACETKKQDALAIGAEFCRGSFTSQRAHGPPRKARRRRPRSEPLRRVAGRGLGSDGEESEDEAAEAEKSLLAAQRDAFSLGRAAAKHGGPEGVGDAGETTCDGAKGTGSVATGTAAAVEGRGQPAASSGQSAAFAPDSASGPASDVAVVKEERREAHVGDGKSGADEGFGLYGLPKVRVKSGPVEGRTNQQVLSPGSVTERSGPEFAGLYSPSSEMLDVRSPTTRSPLSPDQEEQLAMALSLSLDFAAQDPRCKERILLLLAAKARMDAALRSSIVFGVGSAYFSLDECAQAYHVVAEGVCKAIAEAADWPKLQAAAERARRMAKMANPWRHRFTPAALACFDRDSKGRVYHCPNTLLHACKNLRHLATHQQFCTLLAKALGGDFTWYESFLRAVGLRFCSFLCFLYEELSPGDVKSGTRDILDRTRNRALYDAVTALEAMYGFGVVSAYVEKLRSEKFSHPQMG